MENGFHAQPKLLAAFIVPASSKLAPVEDKSAPLIFHCLAPMRRFHARSNSRPRRQPKDFSSRRRLVQVFRTACAPNRMAVSGSDRRICFCCWRVVVACLALGIRRAVNVLQEPLYQTASLALRSLARRSVVPISGQMIDTNHLIEVRKPTRITLVGFAFG